MKKIEYVRQGQTPTLLDTGKANELIEVLNALLNMKVTTGENPLVTYGKNGVNIRVPNTADIDADETEIWSVIDGVAVKKTFLTTDG
jgi:hypothetical protein